MLKEPFMKKPFGTSHINERGTVDNPNFQRILSQTELDDDLKDCVPYFTEFFVDRLFHEHQNYYECVLVDSPITGLPGDPTDIFRVPRRCNHKKGFHVLVVPENHLIRVIVISKKPIKFPVIAVMTNGEEYEEA